MRCDFLGSDTYQQQLCKMDSSVFQSNPGLSDFLGKRYWNWNFMAHLHHLLAGKYPSLMSVTICSHSSPSFASKSKTTKQLELMLLNLVDVWKNEQQRLPREPGQVSLECHNVLKTVVNHEGILRLQSHASCIQPAEVLLWELAIVRHLATSYMSNYYAK